jgi:hypothetical protein
MGRIIEPDAAHALQRKRSGEALQIVCAQTWEHR